MYRYRYINWHFSGYGTMLLPAHLSSVTLGEQVTPDERVQHAQSQTAFHHAQKEAQNGALQGRVAAYGSAFAEKGGQEGVPAVSAGKAIGEDAAFEVAAKGLFDMDRR